MNVRDRIQEFRRVPASQLRPNPKNWRKHPLQQQTAMRGILAEVGLASAVLARELPDGTLELIDGHLRTEILPNTEVPVLVLDVSQEEADKLLATFDPISTLAETDQQQLGELLRELTFQNPSVTEMLGELVQDESAKGNKEIPELEIRESYQVVVECNDETEQQEIYQRLTGEGFTCRVLTL